ncbi:hypothetical protein [Roseospira navarrensis]|uniref:Lipoprotein n=1 Tax=Roseospira navarrensis TaxID=140058 RepID=A0A7X2D5F3_9PROT|nr:hypothetical protein [Roseospira navarrensis]MQX37135.1 hypothetical protein [Roseospira navarrensis]
MRTVFRGLVLIGLAGGLAGMVSGCVTVQRPTIAHTHIGHTMTAWTDTPGKAGLLDTAEREARVVTQEARAAAAASDLAAIKANVRDMRHAIDPRLQASGPGAGYGLRRALEGSVSHVRFAMESADATPNVRSNGTRFTEIGEAVLYDVGLLIGLSDAVLGAGSASEAHALAQEMARVAQGVQTGIDENSDGQYSAEEAGLLQMRQSMEQTLAQENPPYTTVERRWLFNLIRLPSGAWAWRDPAGGGGSGIMSREGGDGGGGGY